MSFALPVAKDLRTSNHGRIHRHAYHEIRDRFHLPSDYACMAMNAALSYYAQRNSQHVKHTSFSTLNGSHPFGLGTNSYKLVRAESRWILRVSTGRRGEYIWLPLYIPKNFQDLMEEIQGDGILFGRDGKWYVMLPVKREIPAPSGCSGEPQFIGVHMGIASTAIVSTPDGIFSFDEEPA